MTERERLSIALLLPRVSIFIVMLVWTLDKFINPGHAAQAAANSRQFRCMTSSLVRE